MENNAWFEPQTCLFQSLTTKNNAWSEYPTLHLNLKHWKKIHGLSLKHWGFNLKEWKNYLV
jgi:hypothetical protein